MAIIIVMKYSIPNQDFPAITTPQGTSSLFDNYLMNLNYTIGVTPDEAKTKDFFNNFVLKAPQLEVKPICPLKLYPLIGLINFYLHITAQKYCASLLCK